MILKFSQWVKADQCPLLIQSGHRQHLFK